MNDLRIKTIKESSIKIIDGDRGVNYPKKSEFHSNEFCLFLNTGNVTKTGFSFNNISFITKEKDSLLRKGKLKRKDIVLTTRGTVGNVGFYNDKIEYSNVRINSGMVILRVDEKLVSAKFLYHFLRSDLFRNQVLKQGSGSAQPQLPIQNLNNIVFPWFDNVTQKAIAKVLSDLDAKIEINNKINAELEAMAKLIYDYWFVQFDFPNEKGKPYKSSGGKMVYNKELKREIPEGWEVKTIGDYCKSSGGFAFKSSMWSEEGALVVKIKDIQEDNTINLSDISHANLIGEKIDIKFISKPGDVLIAMTGATIGKYAIVPFTDKPLYVNQRVGYFDLGNKPTNKLPFLINSLNQKYFRDVIFKVATGAAQPNISNEQINNIKLVTPQKDLLELYNSKMKSTYDKILNNQRENQKLSELRDWLLPMLMNGQVTVKEAQDHIQQTLAAEPQEKYGSGDK